MKRVALIVTGQAEHRALHLSLQRYFPDDRFEPQYRDSFTSIPLPAAPAFNPERPSLVEKLATALVAAVDPGRTGEPADLAVLVDDLELANTGAPERVVRHLRMAVADHVQRRWPSADRRDRCLQLLQARCSFHLLAPMLEAYFFGEPAALRRAGAQREPQLDGARDLEDFEASLRSLDWHGVLARREHVLFGRAFLVDLAHALGRNDLVQQWQGPLHPLTSYEGRDRILRNI